MWLKSPKIWLDISTYCNAGCPQCHRTNPDGCGKADWLELTQWTIEQFKRMFPAPSRYQEFQFCGTWGDPIMNKDIILMVEHIINNSYNTTVVIDTNGSMRDTQFWWDLGVAGRERLTVVFAIDGINQEMHSRYRQKTDLDTILENMQELSSTHAKASVFTVVFKHNEKYINDITEMVKLHGAKSHRFKASDRFGREDKFYFNVDGKQNFLEKAVDFNEGKVKFR